MSILGKATIGFVAVMFVTLVGPAQEKKIERSNLPSSVEKTVAVQTHGAKILGFSKEKEQGKTYYEAETMIDNRSRDVLIDENGKVVEVEEQVTLDSLSSAVRTRLQAKAGKGKIVKVESITKNDHVVAYEAKVQREGKSFEVQVGSDGNSLDHEK